jgi:hypothetical protein
MEWQPIATAPNDGTVILAYRYQPGSLSWIVIRFDRIKNAWINYYVEKEEFPTHWMPLPAAPV